MMSWALVVTDNNVVLPISHRLSGHGGDGNGESAHDNVRWAYG